MDSGRLLAESERLEDQRVRWLASHRGERAARAFAERTRAIYRSAVVRRSAPAGDPSFRLRLIGSYCYLKHYLSDARRLAE